jgi:hypothetical protein
MTTGNGDPSDSTATDHTDEQADEKADDQARDPAGEAWHKVTSDFADLGSRVRTFFEERDGDPSAATRAQESIQDLVAAAERAGRNISAAFRDEGVQAQAKSAVTSLIDAIGTSARDLTERIKVERDESSDE